LKKPNAHDLNNTRASVSRAALPMQEGAVSTRVSSRINTYSSRRRKSPLAEGAGFSPYGTEPEQMRALAPEGRSQIHPAILPLPAPLQRRISEFEPAHCRSSPPTDL